MKRLKAERLQSTRIKDLADDYIKENKFSREEYIKYGVKRGLRNEDGTGVIAGLTKICRVHGYMVEDGEKIPDHGRLIYRGIDVNEIVEGSMKTKASSFEETIWLLIFGSLPTESQYNTLRETLYQNRELPDFFPEDVIMKNPSKDIMNKLARSVLTLYSYDDEPEELTVENNIRQSLSLIARLPTIMTYAYQVKRRFYDKKTMTFYPFNPDHSTAEAILNSIRGKNFTKEEARLLDMCLTLHAEHGGGNNSTFTTRVLTSSDTDIYSTIAGGIGSLKGFKHGGANRKVDEMMADIMQNVKDWTNDDEIADYLKKIVLKQVGDKSGLIYGMGHAIYTVSDPRAIILKQHAKKLAKEKGYAERFDLYERIEKLSPEVFLRVKGSTKVICANVDFYSGLVYEMLGIQHELFTPLFAVARIAGWCAHRLEEMTNGGRIMRPAYRALPTDLKYISMDER